MVARSGVLTEFVMKMVKEVLAGEREAETV